MNGTPENYIISFFNEFSAGCLCIDTVDTNCVGNGNILNQSGPQLFTGSDAAPTFSLGTFSLLNFGPNTFSSDFTLDITSSETPIPEPSSLLMLSTGMLGLVCAVRRKLSVQSQPSSTNFFEDADGKEEIENNSPFIRLQMSGLRYKAYFLRA